jgi:predicted phosphodiesterase
MKRRKFLNQLSLGAATAFLPNTRISFSPGENARSNNDIVHIGIMADVHKDLMPDADARLEKFIAEAQRRNVDLILQLGDFCMADAKNKNFMNIWESFKGPKHHVLGNHDMDKNSKQEMLEFWKMPVTHYSFDQGGIHFIILDANFIYQDGKFSNYDKANFYLADNMISYISDEQIEWFKADLKETKLPVIVLSHQSLWHYQWGVNNRLALQKIMEDSKDKIICCMNGHNHLDFHRELNGIHYIEVNSMSYQWMSEKYKSTQRFPKELYEQYKWLPNIAAYKDPLWAFATIDLKKGILKIEGVKSEWVSPSPFELGMPKGIYGLEYSAQMSDYALRF